MAKINKINAEALKLNSEYNPENIKKLIELQKELKALSSSMMSYIKSVLISKILKDRSQFF